MKDPFQPCSRVVHERLFDRRSSNLIADLNRHVVETHGQWFIATIRQIDDQRAERFVVRRSFKPRQPDRCLSYVDQLFVRVDTNQFFISRLNSRFPSRRSQQSEIGSDPVSHPPRPVRIEPGQPRHESVPSWVKRIRFVFPAPESSRRRTTAEPGRRSRRVVRSSANRPA